MLAQITSLEPATLTVIGGLVVSHAGALIKGYLSFRDRLVRIETKLDGIETRHDRDIDNLAEKLGTDRAKARVAEQSIPPKG
jgi:hypothetical protein